MSIKSYKVRYYVCKCDECGKVSEAIEKTSKIYNAAQAARSIGWSFGKNGSIFCSECRRKNWNDRHIDHFSEIK